MWVERHDDSSASIACGAGAEPVQQVLMPAMHTVEAPDRHPGVAADAACRGQSPPRLSVSAPPLGHEPEPLSDHDLGGAKQRTGLFADGDEIATRSVSS